MENSKSSIHHHRKFISHLMRNIVLGILLTAFSLGIGMIGYHHFENIGWIDAYVDAAMILSGMGSIGVPHTDAGKIFAGTYALFSGIIFLIIMAIIFFPVYNRFFRTIHLEASEKK